MPVQFCHVCHIMLAIFTQVFYIMGLDLASNVWAGKYRITMSKLMRSLN